MWFIYILKCSDKSLYTGLTNNLKIRLNNHNSGKGSAFTRSRLPVELLYSEPFPSKLKARQREAQIKKCSRTKKLALIQGDLDKLKRILYLMTRATCEKLLSQVAFLSMLAP